MLITRKITTMGRVSALLFFFQASFLSKGLSPRVHLQRTQKGTFGSFEKQQKMPVGISNELCVVLTLITEYSVNKTYIPLSHEKR